MAKDFMFLAKFISISLSLNYSIKDTFWYTFNNI